MPLNKLDNFIKNTEGRILYVNPSDLDASDSIDNQGNSLARPFKTIQRAIIEAARFSYVRGNNNDLIEKTTILLFPGEHVIDNRPGWAIYDNNGVAYAVPPSGGTGVPAQSALSLNLNSNFDLTQEDNILYKFNSVYGGVPLPRGISLVGLDLRKTKIRPKYVPNPTDSSVKKSAIFRLTGTCYIWQLSFFDGDEIGTVYTDPRNFSEERKSTPLFSHHKLRCFEYTDGVNDVILGSSFYGLTDLDMYYSKLSNAFNTYREIVEIDRYPENPDGFSKRTPEWEIVGAFATDPIDITNIISGNGTTASSRITVTTNRPHELNVGTPIKIRGVSTLNYNISTKVQEVLDENTFTYLLPSFPINLNANPSTSGATVIVETDTVTGASPYVFNCSLRSVWGMNGMFADGSKASGFKSMVVAQFTGVSLQKDDRAFVKYDPVSRTYNGVPVTPVYGSDLPLGASQTNPNRIYHLDSDAVYRTGWDSSHIKIANDAFIQVVSVFAIGFTKHFDAESGGDFSITNSNSNFGQIALSSSGFRKEAFEKDNKGYITSIIPPKAIDTSIEENIPWLPLDVSLTLSVGNSARLYLAGFTSREDSASEIVQGYRIGARQNDALFVNINATPYSANILMSGGGSASSKKEYSVVGSPSNNIFDIGTHNLSTGEKVIIRSDIGDLPEGLFPETVYYVIQDAIPTRIKLASTLRNSQIGDEINVYGGSNLKILSRVSEKASGEIGSPIQYDDANQNWYINVSSNNLIYSTFQSLGVAGIGESTNLTYIKRVSDERSIDEKIYKLRIVIPKEATNAKDPEAGFIIQESSSTGLRNDNDFTITQITANDHDYKRNPRYISTCTFDSQTNLVTVLSEKPHNLNTGDIIIIKGVRSTTNVVGIENLGYNGTFRVSNIVDDLIFRYNAIDVNDISHNVGNYTNNINVRQVNSLGRFEKQDNKTNIYIYRNEVASKYNENIQDGIYYVYALNASNSISQEFTSLNFSQSPVNLYPQLDRDNVDDNPLPATTYAKRFPIGDVETNDLKKSITRETANKFLLSSGIGLKISSITSPTSTTPIITFNRPHGFGRIISGTVSNGGSGYVVGTHYNVKLLIGGTDPNLNTWNGALATVTVNSSGVVTNVIVTNGGYHYAPGSLYFDFTRIGTGNNAARFTITSDTISNNLGDVIQFTGSSTENDTYHRILSIVSPTSITIARNTSDPIITTSHYAFLVGPSTQIVDSSFNGTTLNQTINCTSPHGLLVGNRVRIIDQASDNYANMGDYLVVSVQDADTFTIKTFGSFIGEIANGYVLKHGLSSNNSSLDSSEENFGVRNTVFYDREVARLNTAILSNSTTSISVSLFGTNLSLSRRFPIGSYIQIDNEIMRITSNPSDTEFTVIRGALGTRPSNHLINSLIKKIKPFPVEFRRPSILRASGHTFEYLGYGPGNYSTALPQVQIKTLTDRESFLSQAQERSCGVVVYNGINNSGDVFAGNTKTLASSGEVVSYDIPQPTVTGQDASALTVVFDEVTIKQKLLVEGGTSGTILSQFDGPVTFNNDIRVKGNFNLEGNFGVRSNQSITFEANSNVDGDLTISETLTVTGTSKLTGEVTVDTGIVPDIDEGAYLGSSAKPFSEAHIGEIAIASGTTDEDDRTISAVTGDLRLTASTQIELLKDTNVTGNLVVSGDISSPSGNLTIPGTITAGKLNVPNISPVGSIMMWPGDIGSLPPEWKLCNGQILTVGTTYTEIRDVLGNRYGGDGTTTIGLPDLRNYFILGAGNNYAISDSGGSATVTLSSTEIPRHTHGFTLDPNGSHNHDPNPTTAPGQTGAAGGHNHGPTQTPNQTAAAGGHNHSPQNNGTVGSVGNHNHAPNPIAAPGQTGSDGGHIHTMGSSGNHTHAYTTYQTNSYRTGNNTALDRSNTTTGNTQPAGDHTHTINQNGAHRHVLADAGAHTHTIAAVGDHSHVLTPADNHRHDLATAGDHSHSLVIDTAFGTATGVTAAHENMPPYIALYYIIRVL
jgi:microcystin-dependent protein/cytoskeletal protein CcmA (bactofilin family)